MHLSLYTKICKFNARDINPIALKKRATLEADQIWNSTADNKRGRSYKELLADTLMGHAAEMFLILCGYLDNPQKYMDLFEPKALGEDTLDVKVIKDKGKRYVEVSIKNTLKRCAKKKIEYNFANKIYIYLFDEETLDYTLEGIYVWDGKKFSVQSSEAVV